MPGGRGETWGGMTKSDEETCLGNGMFPILFVTMVSWVYAYMSELRPCILNMQSLPHVHLCLNKAIEKCICGGG